MQITISIIKVYSGWLKKILEVESGSADDEYTLFGNDFSWAAL